MLKDNSLEARRSMYRERMRKMIDEKKNKSGKRLFEMPEGKKFFDTTKEIHLIDILPYTVSIDNHKRVDKGDIWYERTYLRHTDIGVDKKRYVCPRTAGKKCPICEYQSELVKRGEKGEITEILKAKERQLYNVVDLEEEAKGVQLWDIAYTWFGKILEKEIRTQGEKYMDFFFPEGGYSLRLRLNEQVYKKKTNYVTTAVDFSKREPYDEETLSKVMDLDKALIILPYDELNNVFLETENEEKTNEIESKSFPVEAPEEPIQSIRRRAPVEEVEPKNPCPHGHAFGVDNEKKRECTDCGDEWTTCNEKKEELAKAARVRRSQM